MSAGLDQLKRLEAIAANITYKPHCRVKFDFDYDICNQNIKCVLSGRVPDANAYPFDEGKPIPLISVHTEDPDHIETFAAMTDEEIIEYLYMIVERFERHEQGEFFRYKGVKHFPPH